MTTPALTERQPTPERLDNPCDRALRGSADGLWEWRPDGAVWCSPEFWLLLGFRNDGADAPSDFTTLLHPSDYSPVTEALRVACCERKPFDRQFRLQTSIGEFRWFRAQATSYQDPAGQPFSVAGSVKDITDFKLSAEANRERERRFYRRQRMDALDCLASGISHEFNNLLQAIRGYISFAVSGLEKGCEAADDLLKALEAVDRAGSLTRRLLDFAGAEEQSEHVIDLRETVVGLIELVRPIIGGNIKLRGELTDTPLLVRGDETSLSQALLNLCINARDAMPDGGDLLVRTDVFQLSAEHGAAIGDLKPGAYARIIVSDNGIGVAEQHRDKVFQPFYTTKEVGKGTGLGLPSVLGTVERYGGHVELHTQVGVGATFTIYLPVEATTLPEPAETTSPPEMARVLLVEDDAVAREVGRRIMEADGHHVTCADGGETALELLRTRGLQIDVIVLDVMLPGISGLQVLREARAIRPALPCVLCSGHGLANRAGVEDPERTFVLHKPFDASQISQAIQSCVRAAKPSASRPVSGARRSLE